MDIVITRPKYYTHLITPPLGMAYVTAYLRQNNLKVHLIDALKENLDNHELVLRCDIADIVGIFCMSDYFWDVVDLVKKLKAAGKTVIIGGPHATVMPQETLQYTEADYCVVGEGEKTMLELVLALKNKRDPTNIPGLYSRVTGEFVTRPFFDNLDEIPFPAWDTIDPRTYPLAPHGAVVKTFPVAPVITSRGCPFSCHFCASPKIWNHQIRYRCAENVVDEIELLIKKYGVKEIHFEDDNLTLNKSHIQAICEEILDRNIKVHWATPNGIRADTVSEELLKLMKKSGCYSVAFGIESGSQEILNKIGKQTELKVMYSAIRMAAKAGLITQAFIIFGLPGETVATIKKTINMVLSLPLHKAQFLLLDVLPGSQLWDSLNQQDMEYFKKRSYQEPGYVPDGLTADYLIKVRAGAFRRFHLRPRQMYTILKMLKIKQVKLMIQRIVDFSMFGLSHKNFSNP
ncbi:MAG: radical SAM protein [Candidatus Omnitrophica bacterium]|nr:radical SAM protein [Candidatus Omnitrophota bacterium]